MFWVGVLYVGQKGRWREGSVLVRDNLGLPVSLVLKKNTIYIFILEKGNQNDTF